MKKFVLLVVAMAFLLGFAANSEAAEPYDLSFWTFQDLHRAFYEDAVVTCN